MRDQLLEDLMMHPAAHRMVLGDINCDLEAEDEDAHMWLHAMEMGGLEAIDRQLEGRWGGCPTS